MKASDIKIEGYPNLGSILAHYNAIHVLLDQCIHDQVTLAEWDIERAKTDIDVVVTFK